ncbi:MAG: type II secretion system protein [Erysipelotrichaceae bacterium]|nr:type II secretion system protein [Erysipelotrichaceae bacterium]
MKNNKKGFTLAELLIVIAIIAVLVAIMFPVFGAATTKAQHAADVANVRAALAEEISNEMLTGTTYSTTGKVTVAQSKLIANCTHGEGGSTCVTLGTGTSGQLTVTSHGLNTVIPVDTDVTIDTTK